VTGNVSREVKLPNGKIAPLQNLKHRQHASIVDVCERRPPPKTLIASWPPGALSLKPSRKHLKDRYFLTVTVNGVTVHLILHQLFNSINLTKISIENCGDFEQLKSLIYLIVYDGTASYPMFEPGKTILGAVENNMSPNIYAMMKSR